uniref:SH3 and cysteine-rich domain-containing protein n=1 Tax=Aceria tosichella TaxID=561515 RepID=A0A6G1S5H6_9ACAR
MGTQPVHLSIFKMAFDRLFCPIKPSKGSKKSSALHHNNRQNEAIQQQADTTNSRRAAHNATSNNNNNINTGNSNNNSTTNPVANFPYRHVKEDFQGVAEDEITVYVGDFVMLYQLPDSVDVQDWAYVKNLARNEEGFVPRHILSLEPISLPNQCIKKKLPRSMNDHTTMDHHHHHHQHGRAHSHKTHCTSERTCHSNGGSIKLHQPHHLRTEPTPQFDLAINSLQGSSGCQTFQKFSDFSHFSPPSYYNLNAPHISPQYNECQPFPISYNGYGCYVVMHNFVAREENDLEVKPGDYVTVLNKDDKEWFWVQRDDRRQGFVPARFICALEQVHAIMHKGNSTVTMKSSNQNDFHTYINHAPERESLPTDQQSSVPVYPCID